MSEQQKDVASSQQGVLPWWIRVCRWLWKIMAFLGASVILALIVNVASAWLTSPQGKLPADAPLSVLMTHWPISLLVGCCLLLLAALVWAISRWNAPVRETQLPTVQDREPMHNHQLLKPESVAHQLAKTQSNRQKQIALAACRREAGTPIPAIE